MLVASDILHETLRQLLTNRFISSWRFSSPQSLGTPNATAVLCKSLSQLFFCLIYIFSFFNIWVSITDFCQGTVFLSCNIQPQKVLVALYFTLQCNVNSIIKNDLLFYYICSDHWNITVHHTALNQYGQIFHAIS